MANEFKLSFTANEINTRLGKIDSLAEKIELPTKVSELTNDSGYITGYTESDPTVPSWAKQPNKPTYTASEVDAYSKTEIDDMVFITVDDIDAICVKIIEFSISNIYGEITKYQAKDGMTWAEWIVSDYNTTGLTAEEMTIRYINHNEVETTSAIQEGVLYEEIPIKRAAGLYKSGTNFGELIYTWDEMVEKGAVKQDDTGGLYYFQLPDDINREGDIIISDTVTLLACQCLAGGGVSSDTIIVPSSVTTIEDNVFENVKNIIIPASVTTIDCTAFSFAQYRLENIYYEGSQAQWKNIDLLHYSCFDEDECGGINTYDATIHYNYTE